MMKTRVKVIVEKRNKYSHRIKKIIKTLSSCTNDYPVKFKINVLISDNKGIREYNKNFRKIDQATDVLSFPMLNNYDGELFYEAYDLEKDYLFLGDIIISYEKIVEQSETYNHSFERETAFLLTHGILHLLGYDHDTEEREIKMRNKQEELLHKEGYHR
ncbi:MAG: rRNA maturation RNase YbeY [Clostridia bacterium]|nr:rRNA maturation RNase YbeY [Clostridia bacterium]